MIAKSSTSSGASRSLEDAEAEEAEAETPEEELENAVLAEMEKRGRLPNVSTFAFTATPKPKTLELFGTKRADGTFAPFHLYSMRQAIEEGFILDVLANYSTYKAYWRLLKKVEDDPRYDKKKAAYLLKSFVDLHAHAIGEKVKISGEHFAAQAQAEIGGKAKAMIVTRSRLHAVRYKHRRRRARLRKGLLRLQGHAGPALRHARASRRAVQSAQQGRAAGLQAAAVDAEELETLSRIIADLNERFGLNLGPEHRVTLGQMMEKLDDDAALDAAARVNTRENVRLTFDQKVEHVIQEIVDSNYDLYKRITDDRAFGEAIKNFLFDQYLRAHRNAEELIKRGESKTLEFKSTLRWSLKEDRQDDKFVTHAVLKTIATFLNTEGGDLLIGVADTRAIVGIEQDRLESDDKFMRHLAQIVRNALGDRAGTCIDPKTQIVEGKTVCVVSCHAVPNRCF